jgi:hypothetical protein
VHGQLDKTSETIVSYNRNAQTALGSIIIPFDKRFTLLIPGCANISSIQRVYVYEATQDGNKVSPKPDKGRGYATADLIFYPFNSGNDFSFRVAHDTLLLDFPAIKPGKLFLIVLARSLCGDDVNLAYALNEACRSNDQSKVNAAFDKLDQSANTNEFNLIFFTYDANRYTQFYTASLSSYYIDLHNPANYQYPNLPDIDELNHLVAFLRHHGIIVGNVGKLAGIITENKGADLLNGCRSTSSNVYDPPATEDDFVTRSSNLQTSINYFGALIDSLDHGVAIRDKDEIDGIRTILKTTTGALVQNKKFIDEKMKKINAAMAADIHLQEADVLVSSTIVKDIKTRGGNHFTLGLGLANTAGFNTKNRFTYIPKAFYSLNYYIRSIDKNTRAKDFPKKYDDPPVDAMDYNIASVRTWQQNFAISIGFTLGSMSNSSQFSALFNNGILMIGPSYRLGRAFNISGGLSFLNRENKNPLISNKTLVIGYNLNFSLDIDFVQGVQDLTQLIFK